IYFRPLSKEVVKKISQRKLQELKHNMKNRHITLSATPSFTQWLLQQYRPEAGARSIDRVFLQQVEPALITALMETPETEQLVLRVKDGRLEAVASASPTVHDRIVS
ncbi:hypothetical protein KGQ71_03485, partial [Patescibacteria group bacterium]|nr:hypothetical protein [Patescibacteria group bacterium]